MLRKLLIRTWFGPLPQWTQQWKANTAALSKYGFDFLLVDDYDWFRDRCEQTLGITIAPYDSIAGTRKAGDFDPAYGLIFAEELAGYDFWGHCALDCVYGRLDRYVSDFLLDALDIFANDPGAICGPFTLYRNAPLINNLFKRVPGWQSFLESPTMFGFDEIQFNTVVQQASTNRELRFHTAFWQSHDCQERHTPIPRMDLLPDGTLYDTATQSETMMFHFHRYRNWPCNLFS